MIFDRKHYQHCLSKVSEITDQYTIRHIGSDDPRRSVSNLLETVRTYLGVQVRLLELPLKRADSVVLGMFVMRSDTSFDISYVQDLNRCWKRFVICKEAFHILLDQPEYRDMDLQGHVEALTLHFPNDDSRPRASVALELVAEFAAMEFLFPHVRRTEERQRPGDRNLLAIAERYLVPQIFVERYLSTTWMETLDPSRFVDA